MPEDRIGGLSDALHSLAELAGFGALHVVAGGAVVDVTDHPRAAATIAARLVDAEPREWYRAGTWYRTTSGHLGGFWPLQLIEIIGPGAARPGPGEGGTSADGGWMSGTCAVQA